MGKVLRTKLLLDFKQYNELKDYFRKEDSWSGNVILRGTFEDGFSVKVVLSENKSSFGKYSYADLNIVLLDADDDIVLTQELQVDRVSNVATIFPIKNGDTHYLISIDKNVPLTQETAISRLNIVKWNSLKYDYVKNLVLFNNFNDDLELLETAFAVLSGLVTSIRYENIDELTELLIEKFEYYGYNEEDAIETFDVDRDDTPDKVLYNLVGNLLVELYNPTNITKRLRESDMKDFVYSKAEKYILLLTTKGLIPER